MSLSRTTAGLTAVAALLLSGCVDVDADRMKRRIDTAFGGRPVYSTLVIVQIFETELSVQEQLYIESLVVQLNETNIYVFLNDPVVGKLLRAIEKEGLDVPSIPPIEVDPGAISEDCDDLWGNTIEQMTKYVRCKIERCHRDPETRTTPGIVAAVTEAYRELGAERGPENEQTFMDLARWACTVDYPGDGSGPAEECEFLPACSRLEIHYPGGDHVCLDADEQADQNRCTETDDEERSPVGAGAGCCDFTAFLDQCSAFPGKSAHLDCAAQDLPSGCEWAAPGANTYACCSAPIGRACP